MESHRLSLLLHYLENRRATGSFGDEVFATPFLHIEFHEERVNHFQMFFGIFALLDCSTTCSKQKSSIHVIDFLKAGKNSSRILEGGFRTKFFKS